MCGRFVVDGEVDRDIRMFLERTGTEPTDRTPAWQHSWNLAPTQTVPLLCETLTGAGELLRHAAGAHWSLVPPWAVDMRSRFPTFNARSEGLAGKRTWEGPLKSRRGIVPAAGYYEWRGEGRAKRPYFIHSPEGEVLHFAGLYSWWRPRGSNEAWTLTATIVTRPAGGAVADLHDRAPLVLPDDAAAEWLDPSRAGDQALVDAMVAAADPAVESLVFHEVAPLRGDGPELVEPSSLL